MLDAGGPFPQRNQRLSRGARCLVRSKHYVYQQLRSDFFVAVLCAGCASIETRLILARPPTIPPPMTDEPSSPPNGRMHGTSREYILDRLRREGHVDWLEAIESGRLSAFSVAVELGWCKRPVTLTGEAANQSKRRRYRLAEEQRRISDGRFQPDPDKLSSDQRTFLLYGPDDRCGDAFDTEEEVRAAWEAHKEHLLADYAIGRRPWAWRVFDRPEVPWKGYDRERAINWRAGVLSPEERIAVEREWREDFLRGRDLKSIPRELVRKWRAERRQQSSKKEPSNAIAGGLESA